MSSFEQVVNNFQQFIIVAKVFPPNNPEKAMRNALSYRALVDTGANRSCISEKVVGDLKLSPYKRERMTTAGDPHMAYVYMVGMAIPVAETEMHPETQEDGNTVMKPMVSEMAKGYAEMKVSSFPDIGTDRALTSYLAWIC